MYMIRVQRDVNPEKIVEYLAISMIDLDEWKTGCSISIVS